MNYEINSLNELESVATKLTYSIKKPCIIGFSGELGAGKTTLIKMLAKRLGVTQNVNSPTYTIVNEYDLPNKSKFIHADLYRLKSEFEFNELKLENHFSKNNNENILAIEWADLFAENINSIVAKLGKSVQHISIDIKNDFANKKKRLIEIKGL